MQQHQSDSREGTGYCRQIVLAHILARWSKCTGQCLGVSDIALPASEESKSPEGTNLNRQNGQQAAPVWDFSIWGCSSIFYWSIIDMRMHPRRQPGLTIR